MSNMSYCRFTNTLEDLRDCYDHIDEQLPEGAEAKSRRKLIALCAKIADDYREDEPE